MPPWGEQGLFWLVFHSMDHERSLGHLVTCASKKWQGKHPGINKILLTKESPWFPNITGFNKTKSLSVSSEQVSELKGLMDLSRYKCCSD